MGPGHSWGVHVDLGFDGVIKSISHAFNETLDYQERSERSELSDSNFTNGRGKSTFWAQNGQFDRNLNLSIFGKIWNILEKFGTFWKNFEHFGKILNILEKFGIFWNSIHLCTLRSILQSPPSL